MKIQKRLRVFATSRVSYWPRIALVIFMTLAGFLLAAQLVNPTMYGGVRAMFLDLSRPVFAAWSAVNRGLVDTVDGVVNVATLRAQNTILLDENQRLQHQEHLAVKLADENRLLRAALQVVPEVPAKFTTARIIADSGSGMVRSVVVNAGKNAGVRKGHVALYNGYLLGRVQEVSDSAARIVLITDYNSRIPVTAGEAGLQGILSGDNSNVLKLSYISQPQMLPEGAMVLTSGKGGGLPPGLPVGRVMRWDGVQFRVSSLGDFSDALYVQLVDFGLQDPWREFDHAAR